MTHQISQCATCEARIIWARLPNGTRHPVDADPRDDGNMALDGDGGAHFVRLNEQWSGLRYVSHFATCPDRLLWRRKHE